MSYLMNPLSKFDSSCNIYSVWTPVVTYSEFNCKASYWLQHPVIIVCTVVVFHKAAPINEHSVSYLLNPLSNFDSSCCIQMVWTLVTLYPKIRSKTSCGSMLSVVIVCTVVVLYKAAHIKAHSVVYLMNLLSNYDSSCSIQAVLTVVFKSKT